MKALSRCFIYAAAWLMTALGLHAVTPVIDSSLTDSVELGASYSYQITTAQDGTGDSPVIYNANGLPAGLSLNALTGEISGTPTESGTFSVSLAATNASNETGSATLELTVSDPLPDITSETEITAYVGSSFTYTITATNNPTTYAVIGLNAVPTDSTDTAALATTGAFSFTPSTAAEGGVYNLLVQVTNDAGTAGQVLTVNVAPAAPPAPSVATVVVNTPTAADTYPGSATSVDITATVTPAAGEVIDTVFVRWNNPPAKPDGTPRAPIILSELVESIATPGLYETTVDIGFDPERLEIGGGSIDLEVVAYQTNAVSSDDAASDAATISIAPLLDVVLPEDTAVPFERGPYAIGDIFASARVSTNQFSKISARISGPGIVELSEDDDASDNLNSIFNFTTSQAIAFEGQYEVVVTVEDLNGNSTTVGPRTLQIAGGTAALPVATIVSPAPGFTNEVFSPALFTFDQDGAPERTTNEAGEVTETAITYNITQLTEGQGYYPRDASGLNFTYSFGDWLSAHDGDGNATDFPLSFTPLVASSEAYRVYVSGELLSPSLYSIDIGTGEI
ncbi:MAG: putative Ig domain-containing protein, partial [Opitutales bacterium]